MQLKANAGVESRRQNCLLLFLDTVCCSRRDLRTGGVKLLGSFPILVPSNSVFEEKYGSYNILAQYSGPFYCDTSPSLEIDQEEIQVRYVPFQASRMCLNRVGSIIYHFSVEICLAHFLNALFVL